LGVSRVNQRIDQNRIELAQPSEQECQRLVVVRISCRPSARRAAAAFHDENEMATISFDEKLGIHDAAMVINQMHKSQTPTRHPVMSSTTLGRLIRRFLCGHPDPFRSVRDLDRVPVGCSWKSGESASRSSV
jgi:hypothetical protein